MISHKGALSEILFRESCFFQLQKFVCKCYLLLNTEYIFILLKTIMKKKFYN